MQSMFKTLTFVLACCTCCWGLLLYASADTHWASPIYICAGDFFDSTCVRYASIQYTSIHHQRTAGCVSLYSLGILVGVTMVKSRQGSVYLS